MWFILHYLKRILTKWVIFLQWSIYFSVRMDLQMVFSRAVELPASWCSSKVFIHSSAAPSVPSLPGVTSLAIGTAGPGTNGIQHIQQHQQRNHQHCGMARERGSWQENGELLPDSLGPIKVLGAKRSRVQSLSTSKPKRWSWRHSSLEVGSVLRLCCS